MYSIRLPASKINAFVKSECYTQEIGAKLLFDAIDNRDFDTCKILVNHVDLNAVKYKDQITTPLDFACNIGNDQVQTEMVRCLLEAGADPNILCRGSTPYGNIDTFKLLLQYGMTPIYEGLAMIDYEEPPNPRPAIWGLYIKAIKENLRVTKSAYKKTK